MPLIVLAVLTAGGLALMIRPILALFSGRVRFGPVATSNWRLPAFFASVAAFPFLMTSVGSLVAAFAFALAWAFLLSPDAFRRPVRNLLTAAFAAGATALLVHLAFGVVIGTPLP